MLCDNLIIYLLLYNLLFNLMLQVIYEMTYLTFYVGDFFCQTGKFVLPNIFLNGF
jgi:hypothetical protein